MSDKESMGKSVSPQPDFFVVGIGASAGGLRALEKFFEHIPTDSNAAFVVIQHLSPDFKSLMKELLERRTSMAIYRVTEGMTLQPHSIYLIPPGKNLVLEERQLRLLEQETRTRNGLNFPIDIFFKSLAGNQSARAIGIILSGTGSDGTNGLRAIYEAGGMTMVQEPKTAEFDGMPQTAIATGIVDRVLPPAQLARTVYQLVNSPSSLEKDSTDLLNLSNNSNLQRIIEILAQQEQIDFSHYKTTTLARRVYRRYLISGCENIEDFIGLLKNSTQERAILRGDLLIGVTQFFRDRPVWNFIENTIIPQLIAQAEPYEEIRCWVTACATGEEAYSLAILLDEAVDKSDKPVRFKIFATDINKTALEKANQGIYSQSIVNDISPERLKQYFVSKDNSWQIARKLREKLLFAPHDLTKDAGFTRMNFISCRNVLIYLQSELQQYVLRNLHFSLVSRGILLLGEAESLGYIESEFETLYQKGKIYQKLRDIKLNTSIRGIDKNSHFLLSANQTPTIRSNHLEPILNKAFSLFLAKYKATCFLVDREYRLFHTFNDSMKLIKMPSGRATTDITKLIVGDLQLPLITALHRAKRERSPISYLGIKTENETRRYNLKVEVTYQESNTVADDFFTIVIQNDETIQLFSGERFKADTQASHRIVNLEDELQQTRENLQAVIEELEATNEEQQATNEELIASNEELQSTNEELHSVNEELYTVNAEYQSKIEELTEVNNDIDNLLRSTDIGVVFLDRELKIRKFTPAATVAINLLEADIDRPLEHITHNLDCGNLIEQLQQVIISQKIVDREVKLVKQDLYFLMRINPYLLEDGSLDGVVISFIDIDELKKIQEQLRLVNQDLQKSQLQLRQLNQGLEKRVAERTQALQKSEARLRAILATTSSIIYLKDIEGRYLLVNNQYLAILGLEESAVLGQSDRDLFPEQNARAMIANDNQVLATRSVLQFEEEIKLADDCIHTYISTKAPLIDEDGGVYAICGIATDISQQKQTETELRASAKRESTVLEIVETIRQSLDLSEIFQATTDKLKENLKCDRVAIYRFNPDWSGEFVAESVAEGYTPVMGSFLQTGWTDTCLQATKGGYSHTHKTFIINDVDLANLTECHRDVYRQIQAKAFCIISIFQGNKLWGLLAAYQNHIPRHWTEGEIRLLTQTGIQVGISIAQVDLFLQIQNQTRQLKKAKETAEAANQAKSAFIANTSHELRTPLNAILGFAQILQRDNIDAATLERGIEVIGQSGQHLLTLINDILHIAKIEAGKLNLEFRDFVLPSFLDNLAAIMRIRCQQKAIEFEHKVLSDLPITIRGDETRLRQLLLNLLSNAVKFTTRGKVKFTVGYVRDFPDNLDLSQEKGDRIRFYVQDTGSGIPEDRLTDIFLPFYQLDSHQSSQEGTGLGLTISKNLVEQMGSEIQVRSRLNEGSIFWFDLDLLAVNNNTIPIMSPALDFDIAGYTGKKRQILVVDDLDNNREILVNFLVPLGFDVLEANSGEKAIALTRQHRPDLIILDLIMPQMDGWEVTQNLRRESQFADIPIVIVSASTLPADESYCYQVGASQFLAKPLSFEQLLHTIELYLHLEWVDSQGERRYLNLAQSFVSPSTSIPQIETESTPLVLPSPEELDRLLSLVMQGDIRSTLSVAEKLNQDQPQLSPFTQKIIHLAQTCQLKKLKDFLQQALFSSPM
ncbi:response regulator [Waterburya agarophytonicola K14]|uniref:Circadian input-output histidine kinase CikA n=1 Tax=Waterburya agarophytonicola KI4 TaxID=2874699 RepID=A0A964BP58_9CYAN|nr:chemotaxis protein CheB [Waterburya agarophytonicola]MCC0177018.1 response regulator [Waterburya agarophytonicola KI4]